MNLVNTILFEKDVDPWLKVGIYGKEYTEYIGNFLLEFFIIRNSSKKWPTYSGYSLIYGSIQNWCIYISLYSWFLGQNNPLHRGSE